MIMEISPLENLSQFHNSIEDNSKLYMERKCLLHKFVLQSLYVLGMILTLVLSLVSCSHSGNNTTDEAVDRKAMAPGFFGDSTITIISSNRPNGYLVKIFQAKDLILLNLSRGSINRYIAIHEIPFSLAMGIFDDLVYDGIPDSIGAYIREMDIPVVKDSPVSGLSFMDVNFDGEEELVISHPGYNRTYYACFDLVNGDVNVTPGILQPMSEPPYNNIVSGFGMTKTEFDHDKKTIHIFEQTGCCSYVETWCEMVSDHEFDTPRIQVVREEKVYYTADGHENKTIYKRIDGELKEVSSTCKKMDDKPLIQ